jgi:iron complex transport system permease protein
MSEKRIVNTLPVKLTPNRDSLADPTIEFTEGKKRITILIIGGLLLIGSVLALLAGAYHLSLGEVFEVLIVRNFGGNIGTLDRVHNTIVWEIRLPRIILAILVGFALATAGTVYQGTFRNPLVEPFILGVSAGASFGASLGILYPGVLFNLQVGALLFAITAVVLVYFTSRVEGQNPIVNLILAGVIVSSLFQAAVSILKYVSDDTSLRAIIFWILGGFYYANWSDIAIISPVVVFGFLLIWSQSWKLNVLSMGDDEARALGVNPDGLKLLLIFLATLVTAVAVASVGIIAWVGLMMPHAARMILGPDHRFVFPAAALMGGLYLLICDTLARTLSTAEIPVSIITSILGAPYLFYLLRTRGRFGFND